MGDAVAILSVIGGVFVAPALAYGFGIRQQQHQQRKQDLDDLRACVDFAGERLELARRAIEFIHSDWKDDVPSDSDAAREHVNELRGSVAGPRMGFARLSVRLAGADPNGLLGRYEAAIRRLDAYRRYVDGYLLGEPYNGAVITARRVDAIGEIERFYLAAYEHVGIKFPRPSPLWPSLPLPEEQW